MNFPSTYLKKRMTLVIKCTAKYSYNNNLVRVSLPVWWIMNFNIYFILNGVYKNLVIFLDANKNEEYISYTSIMFLHF